jgi:hypothetical protein
MAASITPPTLGSLGKLPPELRLNIWEDVLEPVLSHSASPQRLAILLTSKTIYAETSWIVYKAETFHFRITAPWRAPNTPWITATCTSGGMWSTNINVKERILRSAPYVRLHAVEIEIENPTEQTNGVQISNIIMKVKYLVDMLSTKGSGFTNLKIFFTNPAKEWQWISNERWCQQTIEDILVLFCKLHNEGSLSVHLLEQ